MGSKTWEPNVFYFCIRLNENDDQSSFCILTVFKWNPTQLHQDNLKGHITHTLPKLRWVPVEMHLGVYIDRALSLSTSCFLFLVTGKALTHILRNQFKPNVGMRPDSKKIAVLITDGASYDDIELPSKNLKDSGIEVFVIGE